MVTDALRIRRTMNPRSAVGYRGVMIMLMSRNTCFLCICYDTLYAEDSVTIVRVRQEESYAHRLSQLDIDSPPVL